MILEFQTRPEAEAMLDTINQMAVNFWQSQGYSISDGKLVGKNAATHLDAADKVKTETWDTVKESDVGTFYFTSLTGTPYEAAMSQLESLFSFTEKELPSKETLEDV